MYSSLQGLFREYQNRFSLNIRGSTKTVIGHFGGITQIFFLAFCSLNQCCLCSVQCSKNKCFPQSIIIIIVFTSSYHIIPSFSSPQQKTQRKKHNNAICENGGECYIDKKQRSLNPPTYNDEMPTSSFVSCTKSHVPALALVASSPHNNISPSNKTFFSLEHGFYG